MKQHIEFDLEFRPNPYKGLLIVIEGIDGSGKSTQAKAVVKSLNKQGYNAAYTKEPTDLVLGQFIRENILTSKLPMHPVAEQYLFNADRVMHMEKVEKLLEKGMIIVMDRYFWSSVAYALSNMQNVIDWYLVSFSVLSFYHQFLLPDYTFFLDISTEKALERITKSGKHMEIYDTKEKLPKIKEGYARLMGKFPTLFTVIPADRGQEEITEDIVSLIKQKQIEKKI